MIQMQNTWLTLAIQPETARFTLTDRQHPSAKISNANFSPRMRIRRAVRKHSCPPLHLVAQSELTHRETLHGPLSYVSLSYADAKGRLRFTVKLGLLSEHPLMLQQVSLSNLSGSALYPERLPFLQAQAGELSLSSEPELDPFFYANGWQSWSPTASYHYGEKQQRSRLGLLANPMIINPGTPFTRRKNHFSADMFGVLGEHSSGLGFLAGFLSQKEQFGSLETQLHPQASLSMWANGDRAELAPGQSTSTDWAAYAFIDLNAPHPMQNYLSAVGRENKARRPEKTFAGWCSWYHYFNHIRAEDIESNLAKVREVQGQLPLNLFQIDDGFQESVGNWLSFNSKFPAGLQPLAEKIDAAGMTPGVWLAPFIVQAGSRLLKEHPDWLLRNRFGFPVNSGLVWNKLGKALDLTKPEAAAYVREVIHTAVEAWGFPYLKLDFLYAAALAGRYQYRTKTRAQVLRHGLELIREAAGEDMTLLGCGCPLGPALGIVDLMRISADVNPSWAPIFEGISKPFKHEPNMPSTRNAIQNILTRAALDPYWWGNDPDCLMVRPDMALNLDEVHSLATVIGITGGSMLISDDLTQLSVERLRIAQALIPAIPPQPHIVDQFARGIPAQVIQTLSNPCGEYYVLAAFNWNDEASDLELDLHAWGLPAGKTWLGREFWTGSILRSERDLFLAGVPTHGVRLFTLHERKAAPFYLGSDLHFAQGPELQAWHANEREIHFSLDLGRAALGTVYVFCPGLVLQVSQDGQIVPWELQADNILEIHVDFSGQADFQISLD